MEDDRGVACGVIRSERNRFAERWAGLPTDSLKLLTLQHVSPSQIRVIRFMVPIQSQIKAYLEPWKMDFSSLVVLCGSPLLTVFVQTHSEQLVSIQ